MFVIGVPILLQLLLLWNASIGSPLQINDLISRMRVRASDNGHLKRTIRQTEKTDQCKHAFHSFLCNPFPKTKSIIPDGASSFGVPITVKFSELEPISYKPKTTETPITTTTPTPITTTTPTTTPKSINLFGDSSSIELSKLEPQQPQPSVIKTNRVKTKEEDICNHPFHAFLCDKGRSSKERPRNIGSASNRPKVTNNILAGESSFITPYRLQTSIITNVNITTSTTQKPITSTTQKPVISLSRDVPFNQTDNTFLGAAQTQQIVALKAPVSSPSKKDGDNDHIHDHAHHHGQDICSDPFHSFLCQKVDPNKRRRNNGQVFQRQKDTSFPIVADSSFLQPSKILPDVIKSTTTNAPFTFKTSEKPEEILKTIFRPILNTGTQLTTLYPKITPKPTTTLAPKITPKPTTTTERVISTFKTPLQISVDNSPRKEPQTFSSNANLIPSAASLNTVVVTPETSTITNTQSERKDAHATNRQIITMFHGRTIDLCKDPFHSFYCQPLRASRKRQDGRLPARFTTTPNL